MAKYNHLPFEDWLLSEEALTQDESQTLQEHLNDCETCRLLAEALRAVDQELRAASATSPAPGFVNRWQARLEADRLRLYRVQTFFVMMLSIGGAMSLLALLAWVLYPLVRFPLPVLLAAGYELTSTLTFAAVIGDAFLTVLRTLVGVIPPTQWAAIWVALAGLGALWIIALQRLTVPRRIVL